MLFAGAIYHPCGGWEDFKGFYDDIDAAKTAADEAEVKSLWPRYDWAHIVDAETRKIVAKRKDLCMMDEIEWDECTEEKGKLSADSYT